MSRVLQGLRGTDFSAWHTVLVRYLQHDRVYCRFMCDNSEALVPRQLVVPYTAERAARVRVSKGNKLYREFTDAITEASQLAPVPGEPNVDQVDQ